MSYSDDDEDEGWPARGSTPELGRAGLGLVPVLGRARRVRRSIGPSGEGSTVPCLRPRRERRRRPPLGASPARCRRHPVARARVVRRVGAEADRSGLTGGGPHDHDRRGLVVLQDRPGPRRRRDHQERLRLGLVPPHQRGRSVPGRGVRTGPQQLDGRRRQDARARSEATRRAPLHDARGLHAHRDAGPAGRPRQGPRTRPGHDAAAARQRPGAFARTSRPTSPRTRGSCSRRPTRSTKPPTSGPCSSRWSTSSTPRWPGSRSSRPRRRYNLTPYEILITASLIEEETKVPEERAKVARVIYNRLQRGDPARDRRHVALRGRGDPRRPGPDRLHEQLAVQHPPGEGPAADADRVARAGQHRGGAEPRRRPVDLLRAPGRRRATTSSPRATSEFIAAKARCKDAGLGCG